MVQPFPFQTSKLNCFIDNLSIGPKIFIDIMMSAKLFVGQIPKNISI